jgi:hypothetical protein
MIKQKKDQIEAHVRVTLKAIFKAVMKVIVALTPTKISPTISQ